MLIPVEALIEYKGDYTHSATSFGAVDDFAPNPVLPLPYEEAISQGIGPQVLTYYSLRKAPLLIGYQILLPKKNKLGFSLHS